tara:strand:+ start:5939 stop:6949 length:1011 start_codon:yes stop_codon:yes gene_type:complete
MTLDGNRFAWVDYAKGIGIFLVVYGHVSRGLVNSSVMNDSRMFQYIDSVIYTFHMPLFFFLSGLFLLSSFNAKGFVKTAGSKLDTILYPYVLWSLLQGGLEVILSNYTNGNVTFGEVLELFTSPRAQFWFLYALLLVFIASLLALYLFGQKVLPVLFLSSVLFYMLGSEVESVVPLKYLSGCLVFFLMGTVFQKVNLIRFNSNYITVLLLFMAVMVQYLFHESGLTYKEKGGGLLFVSTISLLAVISLSERLSVFGFSIVGYLGGASMAIYLMHILAGSGIRVLLDKILGVDSTAFHLVAGTAFGIILPLLGLKFIKHYKIPYIFSFPLSRLLVKP